VRGMVSYVPGPSVMVLLGVTSLKSGSPKSGTPKDSPAAPYSCVFESFTVVPLQLCLKYFTVSGSVPSEQCCVSQPLNHVRP